MTAAIVRTQARTFSIHSRRDGIVYLIMRECADGHGVFIEQSPETKNELGRYWKVWVRDLLLKLDCRHGGKITFTSKSVRFVSRQPVSEWAREVRLLLADVVPLGRLPMWRSSDEEGVWEIDRRVDLGKIIADVTLSETARRYFTLYPGYRRTELRRSGVGRKECLLPISEVMDAVELQVARVCYQEGVPLNWDEIYRRRFRRTVEVRAFNKEGSFRFQRPVVTVELPRPRRVRRRTIRGVPIERGDT